MSSTIWNSSPSSSPNARHGTCSPSGTSATQSAVPTAAALDCRETDHGTDALPADEGVAHGFGLAVQLGRQRQIAEVLLDENAQLLRAPHRSPRPAWRSGALLRSPCSAPTARRGRRAP